MRRIKKCVLLSIGLLVLLTNPSTSYAGGTYNLTCDSVSWSAPDWVEEIRVYVKGDLYRVVNHTSQRPQASELYWTGNITLPVGNKSVTITSLTAGQKDGFDTTPPHLELEERLLNCGITTTTNVTTSTDLNTTTTLVNQSTSSLVTESTSTTILNTSSSTVNTSTTVPESSTTGPVGQECLLENGCVPITNSTTNPPTVTLPSTGANSTPGIVAGITFIGLGTIAILSTKKVRN